VWNTERTKEVDRVAPVVRRREADEGVAGVPPCLEVNGVGYRCQTIIAIEQGKYSPSLEMAFRIARVFGVPLEAVFHYPGDADVTP
jgi:transcriptional regulator with XRE-family HTH domain